MAAPLIDLTWINGAESWFHPTHRDPYAPKLAEGLADVFVFSGQLRYPVTKVRGHESERYHNFPVLLERLRTYDRSAITEAVTWVDDSLDESYVVRSFPALSSYCMARPRLVRNLMKVHQPLREKTKREFGGGDSEGFTYPVSEMIGVAGFDVLAQHLGIHHEQLCHFFDIVLKYPIYGRLAGSDTEYFAHPVRTEVNLPEITMMPGQERRKRPFNIGKYILDSVTSVDEFVIKLYEARSLLEDMGLRQTIVPPEREVLREVGIALGLKARVVDVDSYLLSSKRLAKATSLVDPLSSFIITSAISVASAIYKRPLPAEVPKVSWLHPFLRWDIEQETAT